LTDGLPATVTAGRIGRPHGLDGSVHVVEAVASLLEHGREILVGGKPREIVRRDGTDEHPILRFADCSTREAAEALRGTELAVPRAEAPPLEDDEWYADDLVGCRVTDGDVEVGTVSGLLGLPSCEALEVGDRLIPLVSDAVRAVDLERRVIDVDLAFLGG
jgi:16S rRNA processing protein RimM